MKEIFSSFFSSANIIVRATVKTVLPYLKSVYLRKAIF